MIKNIKILALASLIFVACEKEEDKVVTVANSSDGLPLTAGKADFTKFVSLGNSLTAGFSDNALFRDGQLGSWTNILAEQFKLVGGGEYKIPLTSNNVGGLLFLGNPDPFGRFKGRIYFTGAGTASAPSANVQTVNEVFSSSVTLLGPYNNVGVPGAKSFHLIAPGYGQAGNLSLGLANPFFVRFAPQSASAPKSMLDYAVDQKPSFFSLWIGNNDVLGYATAGGVTSAQDALNGGDITPTATFDFAYNTIINTMTSVAKGGVIANIPYVNSLPFFTTAPTAILISRESVTNLNLGYANYNTGLAAAAAAGLITEAEKTLRTITFVSSPNPLVLSKLNPVIIEDEYLTAVPNLPKYRQTTSSDFVVLSSNGQAVTKEFFEAGNGTAIPLTDRFVLSKDEVMEIKTATDAYNITIKSAAMNKGLAFVDTNMLLTSLAKFGATEGGFTIKSTFATGGAFSMDGVHPAPRGYAYIANAFIREINKTYGSNIKPVDLGNYRFLYPAVIGDGNK